MKYEIGDKIIVLHSDEEGTVIDIINDKMVMIDVRGVKFPAYMDQIDFPYFKMFTQKKVVEKKKIQVNNIRKEKPVKKIKTGDGVWLNFIPVYSKDVFDDDVVDKLRIYLINHNEEAYHFSYNLEFGGSSHFELKNMIHGLSDFYLHDIVFDDLSENPAFSFEFSLVEANKKKAPYFERMIKLRGKQFFKRIEEMQKKNEPSFMTEVFTVYPDKTDEEKLDMGKLGNAGFRMYDAVKVKEYIAPPRTLIDLHIDKLTDKPGELSPREILDLQLHSFEKFMEQGVLQEQQLLTVVHGIGEGVLRNEIHERLRHMKYVKSFINQHHPLYGFGATEIHLQY